MVYTLTRIFRNTHNRTILENAVKKGMITEEEKNNIILEVEKSI